MTICRNCHSVIEMVNGAWLDHSDFMEEFCIRAPYDLEHRHIPAVPPPRDVPGLDEWLRSPQ